ncbi:MAG TPA: TIGR02300 family protein [Acetobacteraceae bacterium]|nr:TIGR02300 family protein [Acetobacteraceae bacterium]
MVGRPELGTKCACASCAERFYDLNRSPAICPKCGATQPPAAVRASRPVYSSPPRANMSRRPPPVIAEEEEAEPLAVDDDDGDEDEDADDIPEIDADADDDAGPVIVHD